MLKRIGVAAALAAASISSAHAQDSRSWNDDRRYGVVEDARPTPPPGMAATFISPPRDSTGDYDTPNRHLSVDETTWHVRAALNMAALACRDVNEQEIVARYNLMLARERGPLAAAVAGMAAQYRARYGARGQQQHDKAMTELYNFFALANAHETFCPVALDMLREGSEIDPAEFPAFAAYALPKLEAPFLQAFAAYDDYRSSLAEWQSRHGSRVVIAASSSQPVAGGNVAEPADDGEADPEGQ